MQLVFSDFGGGNAGNNIFTLIDGGKVLLIDTAFETQAEQVLKEIRDAGLEIDGIIISHFHDDHMYGMKALPKVPTYGSENYKTTLDMWTEKEEHKYFDPTIRIKKDTYSFPGPFPVYDLNQNRTYEEADLMPLLFTAFPLIHSLAGKLIECIKT